MPHMEDQCGEFLSQVKKGVEFALDLPIILNQSLSFWRNFLHSRSHLLHFLHDYVDLMKVYKVENFIGWLGVYLISAWSQKTQNTHKKCETWSRNAKNYTKMTYSPRVFGFQFLGANSIFTTRLITWPGNKNSPSALWCFKKASFYRRRKSEFLLSGQDISQVAKSGIFSKNGNSKTVALVLHARRHSCGRFAIFV